MSNCFLKLGRIESALMALCKRFGSKGIVVLITTVAVSLSLTITMLVNLHQFGHLNFEDSVTYAKAFFIPLIVASISSTLLTRLLVQLEIAFQTVTILSTTDPLTGSANRRGFLDGAKQSIHSFQQSNECIVGMVDLDKFKTINDTHGHDTGDKALKKVAESLEQEIGSHGIVGRLGGDEFAFIIFVSESEIQPLKIGIQKNCSHLELEDGIAFGCSIGMVSLHDGESIDSALGRADKVLYTIKNTLPPEATAIAA